MIVPCTQMTEESHDIIMNGSNSIYKRKYCMLLQRCDELQGDNERIVHRIQEVRKLLKRTRKDRKLLTTRLDQHGDAWRTATLPPEEEVPPPEKPDVKPTISNKTSSSPAEKSSGKKSGGSGSQAGKRKSKSEKDKDPQAPKRPANPFFQFCQEQRPIVTEQVVGEGHEDVSKQELTKLLANRWKSLSTENKKIYYEKYEKQKEQYTVDMQLYISKGSAGNSTKDLSQ